MTNHLELIYKFMTDTITNREQQILDQLIESDSNIQQEFATIKAIKKAIKRNLLTQKLNCLKKFEQALKEDNQETQSGRGKIITFLMSSMGHCA